MNAKTPQDPAAADEKKAARVRDPELLAMERVTRLLESLAPDARARVLAWVAARYAPAAGRVSVQEIEDRR